MCVSVTRRPPDRCPCDRANEQARYLRIRALIGQGHFGCDPIPCPIDRKKAPIVSGQPTRNTFSQWERATANDSRDLTTDEIAGIFDVTAGTVLDWLHQGRFGAEGGGWYRLGKRYYFRRGALTSLDGQRAAATTRFELPRQPATL